jgi:hypothetical protein
MSTTEVANERAARDENGGVAKPGFSGARRDRGGCVARSIVACVTAVLIFAVHNSLQVPKIERPKDVVWLPQNWTEDQRRRYYHSAQGSELLPSAWFLAMEQPRFSLSGAPPFKGDRYLQGFGFIPDQVYEQNPEALPVGFTRDDRFVDPYTGQKLAVLGISCAACHTGELFYGGKAIRIDAGPSLINLQKFTEALGLAVTFSRFCAKMRVL